MKTEESFQTEINSKNAFSKIYLDHSWGSESKSGPGSVASKVRGYIRFLQNFIKSNDIKSITDVGCGDWSIAKCLELDNVAYCGVDVVPSVVNSLSMQYGRDNVRFECMDATNGNLPTADLLIMKDVLQHWPNKQVKDFFPNLEKFKFGLVTNDYCRYRLINILGFRFRGKLMTELDDIQFGECRSIRLNQSPFSLKCKRVFHFLVRDQGTLYCKETMLWRRGV